MMYPVGATTNCEKNLQYYSTWLSQIFLELFKILELYRTQWALLLFQIQKKLLQHDTVILCDLHIFVILCEEEKEEKCKENWAI